MMDEDEWTKVFFNLILEKTKTENKHLLVKWNLKFCINSIPHAFSVKQITPPMMQQHSTESPTFASSHFISYLFLIFQKFDLILLNLYNWAKWQWTCLFLTFALWMTHSCQVASCPCFHAVGRSCSPGRKPTHGEHAGSTQRYRALCSSKGNSLWQRCIIYLWLI